jgi:hypothetical protein
MPINSLFIIIELSISESDIIQTNLKSCQDFYSFFMPKNRLIWIFFVLPIYKSNVIDSTRIAWIFIAILLEFLNSQINVSFIFCNDELSKHILCLNCQCFVSPFNRLRRFDSFILEYISAIDKWSD